MSGNSSSRAGDRVQKTYTSRGVAAPWVMAQHMAPAKAKREYWKQESSQLEHYGVSRFKTYEVESAHLLLGGGGGGHFDGCEVT